MRAYDGPIVDVDVHHRAADEAEMLAYFTSEWQATLRERWRVRPTLRPSSGTVTGGLIDNGSRRADAYAPDGGFPGSDYETLKRQLLDPHGYYRCVLTHDLGEWPAHQNPYFTRELCRAANDWNLDRWLSHDERLHSVIVVPTGEPAQAAQEIRRVGAHPRFAAVLIAGNPIGRPLGDPLFEPIFEAAAEFGLVVTVHPGIDRPNPLVQSIGGLKSNSIEAVSQVSQQAMHYISSLIVHGVFERHPSLRVIIKEYGVGWLPSLMWRLDSAVDLLRLDSPWVRRLPSEYIREHIRLSTQPLDPGASSDQLTALLETVDGLDEVLCFSTDYPHSSMDDPEHVARLLPRAWHRKVFCDNACEAYGWATPVLTTRAR